MSKGQFIFFIIMLSVAVMLSALAFHSNNSEAVKTLVKKSNNNMVYVKGGIFTTGSNPNWATPNVYHKVKLSSFYISKYNVSYGDFDIYTQARWKNTIDLEDEKIDIFARRNNYPVKYANWYQGNNYCHWLAEKTGLPYDLPTDAQWEFVARNRGKNNWPFATNNGKQELGKNFPDYEQFNNQRGSDGDSLPLPIGSIPCTPMGICGLSGEVEQWIKDWFQVDYFAHSPVNNPQGPPTGKRKVMRGGASDGDYYFNNNIDRAGNDPNKQFAGFRCVINSSLPPDKLKLYTKTQKKLL